MEKQNGAEDQTRRLTCRDEEGRPRLMPEVSLMDVIEALCRIEERGQGVLILPRDEKQVKVSLGLRRAWEERKATGTDPSTALRRSPSPCQGRSGRRTGGGPSGTPEPTEAGEVRWNESK